MWQQSVSGSCSCVDDVIQTVLLHPLVFNPNLVHVGYEQACPKGHFSVELYFRKVPRVLVTAAVELFSRCKLRFDTTKLTVDDAFVHHQVLTQTCEHPWFLADRNSSMSVHSFLHIRVHFLRRKRFIHNRVTKACYLIIFSYHSGALLVSHDFH